MTGKRLARAGLWPARRFFDPRFGGVYGGINAILERIQELAGRQEAESQALLEGMGHVRQDIGALRADLAESVEASLGSLAYVGEEISRRSEETRETVGLLGDLGARLQGIENRLESARALSQPAGSHRARRRVEELEAPDAEALNFAESHLGFRAQRDLWFNPPISVEYLPGDVQVTEVSERIAEVPYAFQALAALGAGARVLDVGSSESLIALSLAALGYKVTALDLRRYPVRHPNVAAVASALEDWRGSDEPFDAAVCVSSVEHFGLGTYGEPKGPQDADLRALARVRELVRPGGTLVLTVPYGRPRRLEHQRVYDDEGLDRLLSGWEEEDRRIVEQQAPTVWLPAGDPRAPGRAAVAMVRARRPDEEP